MDDPGGHVAGHLNLGKYPVPASILGQVDETGIDAIPGSAMRQRNALHLDPPRSAERRP